MSLALYTDNVIFLSTYKIYKNLKRDGIKYKNSYFLMSPEKRLEEKARVVNGRLLDPHNMALIIQEELIKEVERG